MDDDIKRDSEVLAEVAASGKNVTGLLYTESDDADVCVPVYLAVKPKRKVGMKWLVLWQPEEDERAGGLSMYEQAVSGSLTLTDYRVRDYMLCICTLGNWVQVNQSQAAKELRIAQPHISASIKKLVRMGIILEGPKSGSVRTYRINPAFVYSGRISDGERAQRDIIRQAKGGATVYRFPRQPR